MICLLEIQATVAAFNEKVNDKQIIKYYQCLKSIFSCHDWSIKWRAENVKKGCPFKKKSTRAN